MQLLQVSDAGAIGPEIHPGIAQVVFNGVVVVKRCGAVRRTSAFRKINGFEVGAGVFDAVDVVLGGGACCFGEFFAVGGIGHGNISCR